MHALAALTAALAALAPAAAYGGHPKDRERLKLQQSPFGPPPLVPITLTVMSRCPDARRCEAVFENVLKHPEIEDKIDLKLAFIGKLNPEARFGVDCMHGDLECAGNAHQLCLVENLPLRKWFSALSCLNYDHFPGAIGTVALTRRCVELDKLSWWDSGVGKCIEGRHAERAARGGADAGANPAPQTFGSMTDAWHYDPQLPALGPRALRLLHDSVADTTARGVKKSCTIEITSTLKHGGTRVCVVDGGVWKGCDDGHTPADFVRVIEEEYENLVDRH